MKIVVDEAIPFIKGRIDESLQVIYVPGPDFDSNLVKDADALIVRTRTRCESSLLQNSKVRLIATATIGTDHIDTQWCQDNGIIVESAPGCNAPGVAQYLFSSLFKSGFDVSKDTLGIIGYGNVGSLVGKWAQEMGIRVLINDPPLFKKGFSHDYMTDLDTLLKESDAVTIHVPFTEKGDHPTKNLLEKSKLSLLKENSILVNSSRGGVVNEADLIWAIKENGIKAIVDVWENEPNVNKFLLNHAKIATPHIAGYSHEGKMRATEMVLRALEKNLDIKTDRRGLEISIPSDRKISQQMVENSYDPTEDTFLLKNNPGDFEKFRNNYCYRHEPFFS